MWDRRKVGKVMRDHVHISTSHPISFFLVRTHPGRCDSDDGDDDDDETSVVLELSV